MYIENIEQYVEKYGEIYIFRIISIEQQYILEQEIYIRRDNTIEEEQGRREGRMEWEAIIEQRGGQAGRIEAGSAGGRIEAGRADRIGITSFLYTSTTNPSEL